MTSHGTYISDAVRDISSKMDEFSKIRVVKENRKPFIELSSSESSSDDEIVEAFDCEPGSNSSIDEIENVDPRLARNKRLRQNKVKVGDLGVLKEFIKKKGWSNFASRSCSMHFRVDIGFDLQVETFPWKEKAACNKSIYFCKKHFKKHE